MNEIASLIQLAKQPQGFNCGVGRSTTPDCLRNSLSDICALLEIADVDKPSDRRFPQRRVKAGRWIFNSGQKFDSVFIVYSGAVKTALLDDAGNETILSFPLRGELLGFDALHTNCHPSQAVALTDCELIVVPFCDLIKLTHEHLTIETWFYREISRALAHEHAMLGVLSTLGSEARVARFLLQLSARFNNLGYSSTHFSLPMTRQEIGSYLGLTLETVSRAFSALHEAQLIDICRRTVVLKNLDGLRTLKKIPSATTEPCQTHRTTANLHVVKGQCTTPIRHDRSTWLSLATSPQFHQR